MPRPNRNELAVKDFSKHIKTLKRNHPSHVVAKDVERWAWVNLDAYVSPESCRKALNGDLDPTACSVDILMAVAGFFEVPPSELGTFAEHRLNAVLAFARPLLGDEGGPHSPDGGRSSNGESSSACTRWPLQLVPTAA